MRRILVVLSKSKRALKTTEIILKCKRLKQPPRPYIQLMLVSALAGESVSWFMGRNILTGKNLEPYHKEARKLYASFGRSLKTLLNNELVMAETTGPSSGRFGGTRVRQFQYWITEEGRQRLSRAA
jgi:hypothetical protein